MIRLRGLTDKTLKSYCTYIRAFLQFMEFELQKEPSDADYEDLRHFIQWIQSARGLADRTVNVAISQLRFFHMYVLHKPWDPTQLPLRKFNTYLPYVPSQDEVMAFISSIPDLKVKAMVSLLYGSGLRIGEVCALRYEDIERRNMRVHISHSKSRSDRYAILSKSSLDILTQYWFDYGKPRGFLFPKQSGEDRPIDTFYLSRHIHQHEEKLGWPRRITCQHSAMHSALTFMKTEWIFLRSKSSWDINP